MIIQCEQFKVGVSSLLSEIPPKYFGIGKINIISNQNRRLQHATCLALLDRIHPGSARKLRYFNGCPIVGNNTYVSFSHDDGLCAVAISQHDVIGADLQRPYPAIAQVRKRFIHPLDSVPDAPYLHSLTILWSLKEAGLKVLLARKIPKSFQKIVCLHIERTKIPQRLKHNIEAVWTSSVLLDNQRFNGVTFLLSWQAMYLSILIKEGTGASPLWEPPRCNSGKVEIL